MTSRCCRIVATLLSASLLAACNGTPIVRGGPAQQRILARTYSVSPSLVRSKLLDAFGGSRKQLPDPFRQMTASALEPPLFSPDWLVTAIDPGGYLDSYKRMSPEEKVNDVLIQDPTGDLYWDSEYRTADPAARPLRFHCAMIAHIGALGPSGTEVQIYELVPTVWPGEHWAFAAHGIGIGRYHDIRFVEPTVTDRVNTLDLLDRVLQDWR